MDTLDKALAYTLENEGGWSNNPNDSGGKTMWGITLGVFLGEGKLHDLDNDNDGDTDADDLKLLTMEQAKQIYRTRYWQGDGIDSERVAIKHFDIGVNCGNSRANKLLQEAANNCGAALTVDGNLGPKSLAAVNRLIEDALLLELSKAQLKFYLSIVEAKPSQQVFIRGWARRALKIP